MSFENHTFEDYGTVVAETPNRRINYLRLWPFLFWR